MNNKMKQWLVAIGTCLALSGCGGDGPTAESTGVVTTPTPRAPQPGRVQFAESSVSVSESAGSASIAITRTNGSDGEVTVRVQSRDGSAVAGVDYTAVDTTVTFADGDTAPKAVTVSIVNDTADEPDETLYLSMTVQSGGAERGATYELLLTIVDDDEAPPAIAPKAVLSSAYRHLRFDWTAVPGATSYRVLKSATAGAPFVQVGGDLPATARSTEIEVALMNEDWLNARYRIAACNSAGCTESDPLSIAGLSVPLIGYLKSLFGGEDQGFGTAIALSADGNVLAIGAPNDDSAATGIGGNPISDCDAPTPTNCSRDSGAVYVYTRTGSAWSAPVYIKASNIGTANEFDYFGWRVALSADGNVLAVGAPYEDGSGAVANEAAESAGAVYVYMRDPNGWSGPQYLKASNPNAYDFFGSSIALNDDGTVLAVGAPYEDSSTTGINSVPNTAAFGAGAVYVFSRSGSSWSAPVYIKAPNTHADAAFGSTVALSSDGNVLAVGQPGDDSAATGIGGNQIANCALPVTNCANSSGAVFIYSRNGTNWSPNPVYIKAPATLQYTFFGNSVTLSSAGDLLVVGHPVNADGVVHSYVRMGNTWSFFGSIIYPYEGYSDFGRAVALSRDGTTLAVGAPWDSRGNAHIGAQTDPGVVYTGSVYVFKRLVGGWSAPTIVKAPNAGPDDGFGAALALNTDGSMMVVGAPWEDSAATGFNGDQFDECDFNTGTGFNCAWDAGAVYVY
jgi:hypothetical protein